MRYLSRLLMFAVLPLAAAPAVAGAPDAPYYGPMKAWGLIGYKFGYKDSVEKDGSWRVSVTTRRGEAIDIAMYRAAEMARNLGYRYVELPGGSGTRAPGMSIATVYARPSQSPADPTTCRSKHRRTCYTADVGEVLRILGGPDGTQPGVPITDHIDELGREVSFSGFGIGAASATPLPPISPRMPPRTPAVPTFGLAPLPPRMALSPLSNAPRPTTSFDMALKAAQPIFGREPTLGWTISD